jgi:hypothetical protein
MLNEATGHDLGHLWVRFRPWKRSAKATRRHHPQEIAGRIERNKNECPSAPLLLAAPS